MVASRTGFLSAGGSARAFASHFAPPPIHCPKVAMSFSESCFFGGMCGSESGRITFANKLLLTLPGATTGPSSPPLSKFSRVVSRKPPFFFSSLWQERQFARMIRIASTGVRSALDEKVTFCAACRAPESNSSRVYLGSDALKPWGLQTLLKTGSADVSTGASIHGRPTRFYAGSCFFSSSAASKACWRATKSSPGFNESSRACSALSCSCE